MAIGECGLDRHYLTDAASMMEQERVLRLLMKVRCVREHNVLLYARIQCIHHIICTYIITTTITDRSIDHQGSSPVRPAADSSLPEGGEASAGVVAGGRGEEGGLPLLLRKGDVYPMICYAVVCYARLC